MILQPVLHHSSQPNFLSLLRNKVVWGVSKTSLNWRSGTASAPCLPTPVTLLEKLLCGLDNVFSVKSVFVIHSLVTFQALTNSLVAFARVSAGTGVTWLVCNSCLKSGHWTVFQDFTFPAQVFKTSHFYSEFILALHILLMSFETNSSDNSSPGHFKLFLLSSGLRSHPFGKGINYGDCCPMDSFKRDNTESFGCLKILFALHWMVILHFSSFSHSSCS